MRTRSLNRRSEFSQVYEEGRKLVSRSLVLYLLPADGDAKAVVASRKVGGAVQRNRAKRLLRQALRIHGLPETYMLGRKGIHKRRQSASPEETDTGLWVVAVARRRILALSSADLESEMGEMLSGS